MEDQLGAISTQPVRYWFALNQECLYNTRESKNNAFHVVVPSKIDEGANEIG